MIPGRGLYAYAIVGKSPQQLEIVGVDKKSNVYSVGENDICVIVSEIAIDQFQNQVKNLISELTKNTENIQNESGEVLQAHETVIEALMHDDTTVVPLKFGTVLKDEKAVLKMVQDRGEEFKSLLARFAGKVEWGLKAYIDIQALNKYVVDTESKFSDLKARREKLSRGAAYLLGKKMEEEVRDHIATLLAQVTEEIFQELGREASEAHLNNILPQKMTGKKKEMILNAAYLVERTKVAHLHQQGKSLMEKYEFMSLDLEFSGPWPPYNFT
ncbi:gas vesicle protein [Reticulibacter mediterranei]|uniref:Gas vesicle protein n=1 Tax=Reticulibacter mediterranei TaxID=2778369 RepID=A0A8J3IL52_9CHLR|nr:GvpL/GvpF family gas vesicle protein [Reticulibacter mediterranei]GHO93514.1 gas vesicle protein [Reticulibacter mediterranei]